MPIRIVDMIVDGRVIRSEEVSWLGLPGARPMTDAECIAEAIDGLWYDRFTPPPGATFRVREP